MRKFKTKAFYLGSEPYFLWLIELDKNGKYHGGIPRRKQREKGYYYVVLDFTKKGKRR